MRISSYAISPNRVTTDGEKSNSNPRSKVSTRLKDVQSFLGFVNFYQRFIKGFSPHVHTIVDRTRELEMFYLCLGFIRHSKPPPSCSLRRSLGCCVFVSTISGSNGTWIRYPLRPIHELLDHLSTCKLLSSVDLWRSYKPVCIKPGDKSEMKNLEHCMNILDTWLCPLGSQMLLMCSNIWWMILPKLR